ncbi:MAG: methyl-accepting chemotaxis protein [Oscillospiraceae bacterium]|nr:methyl-accepting chemotaxis protein [Oscillospiraceae bacterium]
MTKFFTFKKMSSKIAFLISVAVVLVGGAAAGYMQTRIVEEIDNYSRLFVRYSLANTADSVGVAFAGGRGETYIQDIVRQATFYETGFSLIASEQGVFFDTNEFIRELSPSDRNLLLGLGAQSQGEAFQITLNNTLFLAAHTHLHNDFSLFVLVPRGEVMAEVNASLVRFAILFVAAVLIVVLLSTRIGKAMARPLAMLRDLMKQAGTTGDISISRETLDKLSELQKNKDEIGQCVEASVRLFEHINNISGKLESLSAGDLNIEFEPVSEKDVLGRSVSQMLVNLNGIFSSIQSSANQVSSGSKQIADGAQALAQGSTRQSSTVQQLSASISDISEKTNHNAEMAGRAAMLADTIMKNAEKGNEHMGEMISAVKDINEASQGIGKVIKVIDDIAFQTNILALNAAVEAARAGQHGKGFAVVAEEVRNLAAKSADAAKDTGALIANSMEKADFGARIAEYTAASLTKIVSGINESNAMLSDIAKFSEEQASGISQINSGIDQVAQVIQQNSATAQQSAAASQEMSGQSDVLQQMIAQFKLKERPTPFQTLAPAPSLRA